MAQSDNTNSIQLEIILPRSTYYNDETITGIIRTNTHKKLKILILGKCRIDSRWYNTKNLTDFYGTHPVLQQLSQKERDILSITEDTICFYATNILEYDSDDNYHMFGSHLNCDLPHSTTFRSCKYYYEIIALSNNETHASLSFKLHSCKQSIHDNATVRLSDDTSQKKATVQTGGAAARLKIGSCFMLDYSILLLLSNTLPPKSRETKQFNDKKTMRISNEDNKPYCTLTILNSTMHPGSTIHLQFHIQNEIKHLETSIQGIEYTFYDDTKTCKTTKKYLLDSVTRCLDGEEFVGILLCLPKIDCPFSISTDLVELSIFCCVELIVDDAGKEKKLSFQFPINVVHNSKTIELEEEEDGEEVVLDLLDDDDDDNHELLLNENDIERDKEFNINDRIIHGDLIVLSSYLKEQRLI